MIRHVVALRLRCDHDPGELGRVMAGLAALPGGIAGFTGFAHGPNRDYEGKSPDYPYGFTCDFTDAAALQRYASDPRHRALGAALVALCRGGAAGIMVYDFDCR